MAEQLDMEAYLRAVPKKRRAVTGEDLKGKALDAHEQNYIEWMQRARLSAIAVAQQRGTVTINDVWAICPPPEGVNPSAMGAVFRGEVFVACGYTKAKKVSAHARIVRIYKLAPVNP